MSGRAFSLRQRLDIISGALLLCAVIGSCLALELARRTQQDTSLFKALIVQQETIDALVSEEMPPSALLDQLTALQANFLQLMTKAPQDPALRQGFQACRDAVGHYEDLLLKMTQANATPEALVASQRQLNYAGQELRATIRQLASTLEQDSLSMLVRSSQLQLLCILGGVGLFLIWVFTIRRVLTTPLHRMADRIDTMQRTGHLIKLPVIHRDEIGTIALGFNQLSEQVEEQKRRLREHIVDLQRVNTELEEMGKLKDDFLSTISHQLRTPMTAMLGSLELLRDGIPGALNPEQQELVRTTHGHAARLADLIEKALALSLIKSGRRALKLQPDDLEQLLRQVQTEWQEIASAQHITLVCESLPKVLIDAQAIRSVVDQLLSNALRHAPPQSEVTIGVRVLESAVEVSIRDRGPGLSSEQLSQLFEPFTHVQTPEAPGSEGSGLGLAFCHQILERHRGTIRAESPSEGGTLVVFAVPVATPTVIFIEAARAAQEEAEYEGGQFGLLYIAQDPSANQETASQLRQAELVLRRSTHRNDRFIWLDEQTLLIVAVADRDGLQAMRTRLVHVLERASLPIRISSALCPADGETPERVLEAARSRFFEQSWTGHATMSEHAQETT